MVTAPPDLSSELTVLTDDIGEDGLVVEHALAAAALTALLADTEELPWIAAGDSQVRIRMTREAAAVRLRGEGVAALQHACVRCLRDVGFEVPFQLDVILQKGAKALPDEESVLGTGDRAWEDESAELLAQADVVPFDGKRVDVAALIREQIFLDAPLHPTCDLEGASPPPGECTLDPDGALAGEQQRWQDPRWEALRALRDVIPPKDG